MPAMIQLFQERSPGIMLAHETAHQQELLEWVHRGAVELGLTYDMQIAEGMGFTPLGEAQLPPYAILAPDSSWAQQDAVSLLELAEQPLVLLALPVSRDYFFPSSRIWGCAPRSLIGRHR